MQDNCFEINLDVQRCNRDDVSVELHDNCIIINTRKCSPEEEHSIVARKFSKRTYPLETVNYDKSTFRYDFDKNGMLKIQIFRKKTA
jgi:HSP20 family molecular chaperone IbpA